MLTGDHEQEWLNTSRLPGRAAGTAGWPADPGSIVVMADTSAARMENRLFPYLCSPHPASSFPPTFTPAAHISFFVRTLCVLFLCISTAVVWNWELSHQLAVPYVGGEGPVLRRVLGRGTREV